MEILRLSEKADIEKDYFHSFFEVIEGDLVLASAAIYINEYHIFEGKALASFGSFRCDENYSAFTLLMEELIKEVRSLGFEMLIGPIDGSTWNSYRIVCSPQNDPFFLEVENPLFYKQFFKDFGFETFAKYFSTKADSIEVNWERSLARYNHFLEMGVNFEEFDLDKSELIFGQLAELCNESFRTNLLFSPIERDKFISKMKPLKAIINPRYTYLARYEGKVVGFIFCYKDIRNEKEKVIVVKTIARDPRNQFQGIGSVLSSLAMKNAKADGFEKGIHALMVDFNSSTYLSHKFKAELFRKYELLCFRIKD